MSKLLISAVLGISVVASMGGTAFAAETPAPQPTEQPKVTAVAEKPAEVPAPKTHVVGAGDSLSTVATAEAMPSWKPLWDANPEVTNPDLVFEGQKLVVPTAPTVDRPLPVVEAPAPVAYAAPQAAYQAPVRQAAAPANYSGGAGGWAAGVRQRESGGNYATNTGNGYYGAYQFNLQTWRGVGGTGLPSNASPAEQDMRAQMLYNQRGCSPWPNTCR